MAQNASAFKDVAAVPHAVGESQALAAQMPRLILEARRIAATIIHGLHGRRRAGTGENFWQYRRFMSGEPAARIDWRRSARDDHLYVREQEWEAAHTVWIWPDRSPSMIFKSPLANDTKLDRALVMALALSEVLVEGGERVGVPGLIRPTSARNVVEKIAQAMIHDPIARGSLPPTFAQGHVVQIVDPVEETFPYSGRIEFIEPEGGGSITAGRAETWREDYAARIERHRAEIRLETDRLGWSFIIHRTDRPASELLLKLHEQLGSGRDGTGINRWHAIGHPERRA
jgi:uncharacterized protein (DUF58 family)